MTNPRQPPSAGASRNWPAASSSPAATPPLAAIRHRRRSSPRRRPAVGTLVGERGVIHRREPSQRSGPIARLFGRESASDRPATPASPLPPTFRRFGSLLHGQPAEESQLHDLALRGRSGELVSAACNAIRSIATTVRRHEVVERDSLSSPPRFRPLRARACRRESGASSARPWRKIAPGPAIHLAHADQPQIRFVDQRGGLQCVAGALPADVTMRQAPQFVVHEGNQLCECSFVTRSPGSQQRCGAVRSPDLSIRPSVRQCRHSSLITLPVASLIPAFGNETGDGGLGNCRESDAAVFPDLNQRPANFGSDGIAGATGRSMWVRFYRRHSDRPSSAACGPDLPPGSSGRG